MKMTVSILLTSGFILLQAFMGMGNIYSSNQKNVLKYLEEQTKMLWLPDSVSITFANIPAGKFLMGSPENEEGRDKDESPQQEISVNSFWIGTHEVTQKQWLSVMGYNPATFQQKVDHLSYPVETVTWEECQVFIDKLNNLGLGKFRLSTEAEWEYACRAETTTAYYWGNQNKNWEVNKKAWINSRSLATTHPVGTKPANPWGLYDMAGNVWEWTNTTYAAYGKNPKNDSLKVFRGGSWFDFEQSQRSANRHKHKINEKFSTIGLRLVWENE